MTTDPPIACSLEAGDLRARLDGMAALGRYAFLDAERAPRRAVLRFAPRAGVRERLDALVAAEARCCPFLTLTVKAAPDAVTLTVEGPEGSDPVIAELADALGGAGRCGEDECLENLQ